MRRLRRLIFKPELIKQDLRRIIAVITPNHRSEFLPAGVRRLRRLNLSPGIAPELEWIIRAIDPAHRGAGSDGRRGDSRRRRRRLNLPAHRHELLEYALIATVSERNHACGFDRARPGRLRLLLLPVSNYREQKPRRICDDNDALRASRARSTRGAVDTTTTTTAAIIAAGCTRPGCRAIARATATTTAGPGGPPVIAGYRPFRTGSASSAMPVRSGVVRSAAAATTAPTCRTRRSNAARGACAGTSGPASPRHGAASVRTETSDASG